MDQGGQGEGGMSWGSADQVGDQYEAWNLEACENSFPVEYTETISSICTMYSSKLHNL